MTANHDAFADAIEQWLQEGGEQEHPSRVLDQVVSQLDLNQVGPSSVMTQTIALAAAVLALVAFVGFNLVSSGGSHGGPTTSTTPSPAPTQTPMPSPAVPQYTGIGFIGLPPPGAAPSTLDSGELVDSYPVNGGGPPFLGMVRLYADGRMIWYRFYSQASKSTGYLEQRLTAEGVELVRSHRNLAEKDPLRLASWLPASAWEDQEIRAYVPSGYAVCLEQFNPSAPIEERVYPRSGPPEDRSGILDQLPASAADLLRDAETLPPLDDAPDCLAFTTDNARLLDAALRDGGLARDQVNFVLQYYVPLGPPGSSTERIIINFEPRFPDGTNGCSACG